MDPFILGFSFVILVLGIAVFFPGKNRNPPSLSYSILIPFKNEQHYLPFLLTSLRQLQYPEDLYEIIFVDDWSDDNSLEFIREYCEDNRNARYFQLKSSLPKLRGKKAALKLAAAHATGEILLYTDADCIVTSNWIDSYNYCFSDNVGMVAGWVFEQNHSSFSQFIDYMKAGIFASTIAIGLPFSASGGNLAIRKSTFEEISGYDRIINYTSGDDKLMVNEVRKTRWKIRFNPEKNVETFPVSSRKQRWQQLKRRYGKYGMSSTFYKLVQLIIFLLFIYLAYRLLFQPAYDLLIYPAAVYAYYLMITVHLKVKFQVLHLFQILIYPYYVIFLSLIGFFSSWSWKSPDGISKL